MLGFTEEALGIYRLKVPFEAIYTSVFLIKAPHGAALVDCATTAFDVDNYISPSLADMGYKLSDINFLVLTHSHSDHAGGLSRILELCPDIAVIRYARLIFDGIYTYPMSGHTVDCIGVFDGHTKTLISGDGLQGAGVDKYRCAVKDREAYLATLDRIKNDKNVENVLFSHAYEPWYKDSVCGRENVLRCLEDFKKYL